jgi:hypothetical protein
MALQMSYLYVQFNALLNELAISVETCYQNKKRVITRECMKVRSQIDFIMDYYDPLENVDNLMENLDDLENILRKVQSVYDELKLKINETHDLNLSLNPLYERSALDQQESVEIINQKIADIEDALYDLEDLVSDCLQYLAS